MTTLRDAIGVSSRFAALIAGTAFAGAAVSLLVARAPLYVFIIGPALCFAVYFLFTLVLQLTGAADSDLNINAWFAWAVCGGLVSFMVGLLIKGHELFATLSQVVQTGLLSAFAWIACVVLVWLVRRAWLKRGA